MFGSANTFKNRFRFIFPLFFACRFTRSIGALSLFHATLAEPFSMDDVRLTIDGRNINYGFFGLPGKRSSHIGIIFFSVAEKELESMAIHNKVRFEAFIGGKEIKRPITYDALKRSFTAAHGPLYNLTSIDSVAFFRQNVGRSITLTVRHRNTTDRVVERIKISLAYWLERIVRLNSSPVLLFEKNANKYGESGRTVFERLVDEGDSRARFVISEPIYSDRNIPEKYRKHFVRKYSFEHYRLFFRAKTFIGTEAMSHAIELRVLHRRALEKLADKTIKYVFLQHGVMYMVSLDSPQRSSFRRRAMPSNSKVVVSSRLEANHFIEYAGFSMDDLIMSGLPKFDTSYMNPDADKILIMPTWRIWEFNEVKSDPENSGYGRMIKRIYRSIPESLKEKVLVIPHPLFDSSTFGSAPAHDDLDVVLRDVRLLITDYSSIAYDAFYRGANVVFYWSDLAECMDHYGGSTHLMINEETAFGPTCYNERELRDAVNQMYGTPQGECYQMRYKKIVTFDDGRNTCRLLAALKDSAIL